jgi:2-polyprenyl-3-methyl-5-hydroxy-6-metoxy-1,4-benzoquinol methylase
MQPDYSIYYRRFHDESEEHAERMAVNYWRLISDAIPPDKSARILDIGCGFGFALRALRNAGYSNIVGIDTSPQQVERALKAGFEVEVVTDSAKWLRECGEDFDAVILFDVLEHVRTEEQIALLSAVRSALKQNGVLILQVPNANSILSMRWRYNDFTHYSSFTEHSLHFVLANAGFSNISIDVDKGIGRIPRRVWSRSRRSDLRKWIVRWAWLQVFKAELPWENLELISFELNLRALARA